ncbi:MAG: dihydrolipoamide acetyltransferase [Deltaproteobacteria bacterium]|nr:dihydrolipoamide acetyltransferase [Deltaproteobacteria bacterium]
MRRTVALSVALLCMGVGGAFAAAQAQDAPAPNTSSDAPAAPVVAAPAAPDRTIDAGTYAVRLRDLEQRINELKEQIFRSKARLSLLAETVLEGVVGGGQAVIIHENRMSQSYRLVRVVYALDGAPIFTKADEEGSLGEQQEFEVYNGSIVPGEHTLTVNLEYRGHGYGVFAYLKGYRFKVRSTYTFAVPEGRVATVHVVGYEKGGPTTPLEERPAVRYIERVERQVRPDAGGEGDR